MRKGIILAGGKGTRLFPLTLSISKQLLPIFDKPMIFYPLSTLMLSKIREYLIISSPEDINDYKLIFGNGSSLGIKINYKVQEKPEGLAQALILAESFLNGSPSALILGDNFFYSNDLQKILLNTSKNKDSTIFLTQVSNPKDYGVAVISKKKELIKIIEKPKKPKSNLAVTGLYFYDHNAPSYAKKLSKSNRGEYEISDLNNLYLKKKKLNYRILGRGFNWFDTGSPSNLLDASIFVRLVQERSNVIISSPEEISYRNGWISKNEFAQKIKMYASNYYGQILKRLVSDDFA